MSIQHAYAYARPQLHMWATKVVNTHFHKIVTNAIPLAQLYCIESRPCKVLLCQTRLSRRGWSRSASPETEVAWNHNPYSHFLDHVVYCAAYAASEAYFNFKIFYSLWLPRTLGAKIQATISIPCHCFCYHRSPTPPGYAYMCRHYLRYPSLSMTLAQEHLAAKAPAQYSQWTASGLWQCAVTHYCGLAY